MEQLAQATEVRIRKAAVEPERQRAKVEPEGRRCLTEPEGWRDEVQPEEWSLEAEPEGRWIAVERRELGANGSTGRGGVRDKLSSSHNTDGDWQSRGDPNTQMVG